MPFICTSTGKRILLSLFLTKNYLCCSQSSSVLGMTWTWALSGGIMRWLMVSVHSSLRWEGGHQANPTGFCKVSWTSQILLGNINGFKDLNLNLFCLNLFYIYIFRLFWYVNVKNNFFKIINLYFDVFLNKRYFKK